MGLVMLFAFAGWGISVGGLAKVTNECREKETTLFAATQLNSGHLQLFPNVDEDSAYNCGVHFSLDWWIVAFELFYIIYATIASLSETLHSKHTVMAMNVIVIFLYTVLTSVHVKIAYNFNGGAHSDDEAGQSYKAVAAGGIVVCICNYIHLFVFGMREVEETAGQPVVHVEQ